MGEFGDWAEICGGGIADCDEVGGEEVVDFGLWKRGEAWILYVGWS